MLQSTFNQHPVMLHYYSTLVPVSPVACDPVACALWPVGAPYLASQRRWKECDNSS